MTEQEQIKNDSDNSRIVLFHRNAPRIYHSYRWEQTLTKKDLMEMERRVAEEVLARRRLGGYSADSNGILLFGEAILAILRHLNLQMDKGGRK